jgi:AP-3 complex subunit sigma
MLDLIQVYVETLDRVFENVCELDLIFNSPKAYTVLDETIVGGLVLEINTNKILNVYDQLMKLEKMHSSLIDKIAIS